MPERLKPNADGEVAVRWSRPLPYTRDDAYREAAGQRGLYIIGAQSANPRRFYAVYVGQAGAGQYSEEDIQSRLQTHTRENRVMEYEVTRGPLFCSRTTDIGDWTEHWILSAEQYVRGRLHPFVDEDNSYGWRTPITINQVWWTSSV